MSRGSRPTRVGTDQGAGGGREGRREGERGGREDLRREGCIGGGKRNASRGKGGGHWRRHVVRGGHWRVLANSPQPRNANANVTFDYPSIPKVTFAFAFPELRAVC